MIGALLVLVRRGWWSSCSSLLLIWSLETLALYSSLLAALAHALLVAIVVIVSAVIARVHRRAMVRTRSVLTLSVLHLFEHQLLGMEVSVFLRSGSIRPTTVKEKLPLFLNRSQLNFRSFVEAQKVFESEGVAVELYVFTFWDVIKSDGFGPLQIKMVVYRAANLISTSIH